MGRMIAKKPGLTPRQAELRLDWCNAHVNWSTSDLSKDDIIFQGNNAPIHWARYTHEWMESENIQRLPWPAQSSDINPIENIWKILKDNVQ
ncbi:transposable element tc3 transposase [Gigaspora margarita]|uniref:Transposable element tc3 transposase n=1 Tax=Gigaspora margarita TaxID=4874 RepID=A0A8H4EEP4_GIGMA|nr:transposable element tc3 transposase [Gigaspora margarita]